MASPRRFVLPLYAVILVMICMASSVTSHLELTDGMAELPRQTQSPDMREKATATVRFLRGGNTNGDVNNEVVGSEERGIAFLDDAVAKIALKLGLKASLRLYNTPHKVLQELKDTGHRLNEQILLVWMGYVLKYRGKMGDKFYADDAYVVSTLSEFIPKSQFPVLLTGGACKKRPQSGGVQKNINSGIFQMDLLHGLLKAMKKNKKLRSFAEDLQKLASPWYAGPQAAKVVEGVSCVGNIGPQVGNIGPQAGNLVPQTADAVEEDAESAYGVGNIVPREVE
ncbi:Hypothetical protein PHPALM_14666 [Phytophthora palmivora]|uniref:RxLR effector n=1 Tax=Phytophthora palmivora TaxID=4796 RepID=A0A2P4XU29_9STRA|nr:Hypothetical protein PHPALM_14666 [Phytophthora palmivora]